LNRDPGAQVVSFHQFQRGEEFFSLLHSIQTGSGAHPDSYKMVTGVSLRRGKVEEASWNGD
jgi:hypothetical protein